MEKNSPHLSQPLQSDKRTASVQLQIQSTDDAAPKVELPQLPGPVNAALAGTVAAVVCWILCCGLAVLWWLSTTDHFSTSFSLATKLWFLSIGAKSIFGVPSMILPLGLTALVVLVVSITWNLMVARKIIGAGGGTLKVGRTKLAAIFAGTYTLTAVVIGFSTVLPESPSIAAPTFSEKATYLFPGFVGAALVSSLPMICVTTTRIWSRFVKTSKIRWLALVPQTLKQIIVLEICSGILVLVLWIILRLGAVNEVLAQIGSTDWERAAVIGLQFLWSLNLICFALAYCSGPGFKTAQDSLISPYFVQRGAEPDVPIMAAFPTSAFEAPTALVIIPAIGVIVGMSLMFRSFKTVETPATDFAQTSRAALVVGGLVSLCGVISFVLAGGNLGTGRLVGIGPVLPESLLAFIAIVMTSALFTAFCWWTAPHIKEMFHSKETFHGSEPKSAKSTPLDQSS